MKPEIPRTRVQQLVANGDMTGLVDLVYEQQAEIERLLDEFLNQRLQHQLIVAKEEARTYAMERQVAQDEIESLRAGMMSYRDAEIERERAESERLRAELSDWMNRATGGTCRSPNGDGCDQRSEFSVQIERLQGDYDRACQQVTCDCSLCRRDRELEHQGKEK